MPTRRQFLLECSVVAATATVTPSLLGSPIRLRDVPLEQVGFAKFAACLRGVFEVQPDSGAAVPLRLVEASLTPRPATKSAAAEDAVNEKFSLLFRGPLHPALDQGTYWFQHSGIGRFPMFIVPIGSTETNYCWYEAVFNRPMGGQLPRAGEGMIPLGRPRNQPGQAARPSN